MLIQVGDLPRSEYVRSEFWSHGLFGRVITRTNYDNWGYIRLWQGHPWQDREVSLRFIAEYRAQQCLPGRPAENIIDLAISGAWVVFRYGSADIPLPRGCTMMPDRYWYRYVDKRTTSFHRRTVASMESMCCYLCRVMQSSTP